MDNNDRNNPRPPQKTNPEKVAEYLEFGSPIRQALLINAMQKETQLILDNKDKVREIFKGSFISADA